MAAKKRKPMSGNAISRRTVVGAGLAGIAGLVAPATAQVLSTRRGDGLLVYDEHSLRTTLDFSSLIREPVVIDSIEVLQHSENTRFVRVRSTDGAEGIVIGNMRLPHTVSLLEHIFRPMLIGTDARDMERTFDDFFRTKRPRGYKYSGLPYFIIQGHCELAILDMFGRMTGKSVSSLFGRQRTEEIEVYMSRLSRTTTAEEEIDIVGQHLEASGARAIKVKIGARMNLNADAYPGRSEALVSGIRKRFGDELKIFVDANGSYDVPTAIRVGRMLEDWGVEMYEEPCDWEDFEMTRQVTEALDLPVAGGEQDTSLPKWRWMAEHRAVDILQPDIMYNGGFMRTLHVAEIAAQHAIDIAPHYPRSGPEVAPLIHFCTSIPNFKGFMEYRADHLETDFDYEPVIRPVDGKVPVPTGPGFGIDIDSPVLKS